VRPSDRSADELSIVLGDHFLESNSIHPTLLGQRERLPHMGTTCRKRICGLHGLALEVYVSCVSYFPYRVYINLNHRDS
jgi:hypothetical protein